MSKSYATTVELYESEKSIAAKVRSMYTDPAKVHAQDPGHPLPCPDNEPGCVVFALHQLYGSLEFVSRREKECQAGEIGCVACKRDLLEELDRPYSDFRKARECLAGDPTGVEEILKEGSRRARAVAQKTMQKVRRVMRLI
jgi:tryptophanyl-tRNA synthetase